MPGRIMRRLDDFVCCGGFSTLAANRQIDARLEAKCALTDDEYDKELETIGKQLTGLTREQAVAFFEATEDRQKRVEDKAKVGLLGITVAAATFSIGAKITLEGPLDVAVVVFLTLVLLAAIAYLGLGGYLALRALLIRAKFDVTPEQASQDDSSAMASYIWARNQNEHILLTRTNLTSVSLRLAGRGVALMLVFILLGSEASILSRLVAQGG